VVTVATADALAAAAVQAIHSGDAAALQRLLANTRSWPLPG
jgi:hypothetical protein